jgi:hypothetical protein
MTPHTLEVVWATRLSVKEASAIAKALRGREETLSTMMRRVLLDATANAKRPK